MRKYTKPVIQKVDLNPEQAILGTCSVGVTSMRDLSPLYCRAGDCKQKRGERGSDYAATS